MADETWSWREMPILEAVIRLEGTGEIMGTGAIAQEAGIADKHEAAKGIAALVQAGYLVAPSDLTSHGDQVKQYIVECATEKARLRTGQWPTEDPFGSLLTLLEERIAATDDADEKTKLSRLRDALVGAGESLGTSVLLAYVKHWLHLP